MRNLFGVTHRAWDHFFSLIFLLSHHGSVSFVILFESDANKTLYCPIFFWLWLCHSLLQVLLKYEPMIAPYVSMDRIWSAYWKIGPYLIGYWYVVQFQQSDNECISLGLLLLFFGRWALSYNWPDDANWPKTEEWRDETVQSIMHLLLGYVYCNGFDISLPMVLIYTAVVCYLQQARKSMAATDIKYDWSE